MAPKKPNQEQPPADPEGYAESLAHAAPMEGADPSLFEAPQRLSDGAPEPSDEGEWVIPAEGVVIAGTVERAFFVVQNGEPRVAYAIRDQEGALWLQSERYGTRRLREFMLGCYARTEYTHKEAMERNGRPTGKTVWRIKLDAANPKVPKGQRAPRLILDVLKDAYKALEVCPF